MEPTIEIRKIPVGSIYGLIHVLEISDSWKKLMSHIPKEMENKIFIPKYGTDHMQLIESASVKQKRPCTEILFEEWGTSGRIRPTIGTLLQILVDAELFRAADIVAVDLLKNSPPKRPLTGPAARVDVSLPHILAEKELNKVNVESLLNNLSYPNLTSSNLDTFNQNMEHKNSPDKPEIDKNFLAIPSTRNNNSGSSLNTNPSASTNITHVSSEVTDMIQFSAQNQSENFYLGESTLNADIPAISMLLNESRTISGQQTEPLDEFTEVKSDKCENPISTSHSSTSIEAINMNVTNGSSVTGSEYNIPDFSGILKSAQNIPNISILQGESRSITESSVSDFNMPDLNALQFSISEDQNSTVPILSAFTNSILQHFSYKELQNATNNFSENFVSENSEISSKMIGAGGFGTVYLTSALLNYPVAVKKLKLLGPAGQFSEPIISKQFKTEVEILSKYNHDNILALLGYSCDGPNYCMIYEYIDGGSLRESIANDKSLTPRVRESIALQSAQGIEYLHNGFPTPFIHRDIKSANILLTKSHTPKICDFGIVKLLPNQSVTSNIMGTIAYMAPEAFRGDVSVKMDVFSFGVVILELLTGLPPMDDTRPGKDIYTHVYEMCSKNGINPLLDKSIDKWENAENLFSLALYCLKKKNNRPLISEVVEKLKNFNECGI